MQSDGVAVQIPVPREWEFGLRNPRTLQDTKLPSKNDVEDHNLAEHMPYRNWCTFCVMGRGKATPHKKQSREDGLPELHLDYCLWGSRRDQRRNPGSKGDDIKDGLGNDGSYEGGAD